MVNPQTITNYNLTDDQLEEHLLFWICAAGKNGTTAARCLDLFLNSIYKPGKGPFKCILSYDEKLGKLPDLMKFCGIGCYKSKSRSFIEAANSGLDLRTCSAEDLEKIHGIGMKTSRCFILHSRSNAQYAGLDTHILKFLRSKGVDAPRSTPGSKKKYLTLEKKFLYYAKVAGMTPADFDLEIWKGYAVLPKNGELK